MPYTPQIWTNGVSKLNADRMGHIETGIDVAHTTADAAIAGTIVDAKGDLIAASAADTPARLAVGANDTVLVAASGEAAGLKYQKVANANVDAAAAIDVSKLAAAWASYTPTWASTGATQPTLGNGTITGKYVQIGKLVFFKIRLTMGGTTTFGVAAWKFSLPVAAAAGDTQNGHARAVDASASAVYHHTCSVDSGNGIIPTTVASPVTYYGDTNPITWASGDTLDINGVYEAA